MKAYIFVDIQNDFISGVLGSKEAQEMIPRLIDYIHNLEVDESDIAIITQDTHFAHSYGDYLEGRKLPIPHCIKDTEGWQIPQEVRTAIRDKFCYRRYIEKQNFSSHDIIDWLDFIEIDTDGYDEIIFMGICTDICVISNVLPVKMYYPETPISVVADCCAGTTPENHQNALNVMKSCQVDII